MNIEWNVIVWCCITNVVLIAGFILVYYIMSAKAVKKRRNDINDTISNLKPGREIIFCGGIKGEIVKIDQDYVDVKVSKDTVITIALFSINQVLEKPKRISKEKIAQKKKNTEE